MLGLVIEIQLFWAGSISTMDSVQKILWQPSTDDIKASRLTQYKEWLYEHHGLTFTGYESLWQWSVDKPAVFWETIVHFFNVQFHSPYNSVLSGAPMPETVWFDGGTLNYAEHIFKGMKEQETAMLFASESEPGRTISVEEM
ncbi:MAG TPA: acetyl-coenzyme A synthetase N-terminal domain-containing protein, partial [Saprospiraceae bacterium]|nr:acetyl-coenzyme A synthetase N-terminal domain-containing protein [Saprospiraceae bacterium]